MGEKRNENRGLVGKAGGTTRKAYVGGMIILKRILKK
jgi:hypothetical protein